MSRIKKDPKSGCWNWQGCTGHGGHGTIRRGGYGGGGTISVTHRVSWEIHRGPIPDGLKVLHKCDNPPCVNPDHLFLGTQADNVADMWAKGRGARSMRLPFTKLTDADILKILNDGRPQKEIAASYGITQGYVSSLLSGRYRRYLSVRSQR